jgi:hypothetical protein
MNEFLPVGDDRRTFARGSETHAARQLDQLEKVEAAIAQLNA